MSAGFVYVLVNSCMPDIVKVGASERHPQVRADELSEASGIPTPFTVAFFYGVADWSVAESLVHESLRERRVNAGREFFTADVSVVARLIKKVAEDLGPTPHEGLVLHTGVHDQTEDAGSAGTTTTGKTYMLVGGQWVERTGDQ